MMNYSFLTRRFSSSPSNFAGQQNRRLDNRVLAIANWEPGQPYVDSHMFYVLMKTHEGYPEKQIQLLILVISNLHQKLPPGHPFIEYTDSLLSQMIKEQRDAEWLSLQYKEKVEKMYKAECQMKKSFLNGRLQVMLDSLPMDPSQEHQLVDAIKESRAQDPVRFVEMLDRMLSSLLHGEISQRLWVLRRLESKENPLLREMHALFEESSQKNKSTKGFKDKFLSFCRRVFRARRTLKGKKSKK